MKSGKFDTPIDFNSDITIDNYHIEYLDLIEVAQGSPRIGKLSINGDIISNYRFGGPFVLTPEEIYVPVFMKSSFLLARINLRSKVLNFIGGYKGIIDLEKIEEEKIFYYDSLERVKLKFYDISKFIISNSKDTPENNGTDFFIGKNYLRYINIAEVGRKKEKIGQLFIENKDIFNKKFGSPFLYNNSYIIIPVYMRILLSVGFKIAFINLYDNTIKIIGKLEKTISLKQVDNNKIYYYSDSERRRLTTIDLDF